MCSYDNGYGCTGADNVNDYGWMPKCQGQTCCWVEVVHVVTEHPGFLASHLLHRLYEQGKPSMYRFEFHKDKSWYGHDRSYDHHVGTVLPQG